MTGESRAGIDRREWLRLVSEPGTGAMDDPAGADAAVREEEAAEVMAPHAVAVLEEYPETEDELLIRAAVAEGPVPVDPPDGSPAGTRAGSRGSGPLVGTVVGPDGQDTGSAGWVDPVAPLRVLPSWASREQFPHAVRWLCRYVRSWCAFHAVRVPLYAWRVTARTPRGSWRVAAATWRWVFDHESLDLRRMTGAGTTTRDAAVFLAVSKQRNERVKLRGSLVGTVAGVVAVGAGIGHALAPGWAQVLAVALVMLGLARLGTNADAPITDRALVTPRARRLTADVLTRAFAAAGLSSEKAPIAFPAPICRDGPGWRAVIDLPFTTTAETACKRRDRIAAGLDLDEVQVWPERVRGTTGSARRLALWVADEDPYEKPSGAWPLTKSSDLVDVFTAFPFGQDQRGREVDLSLMFTSLVVGSIPRQGKTFAARLPVLAAALDPTVELHVWCGKGGQDWRGFVRIAHRCGFGVRDEVVADLLDDLTGLQREMNRRYDVFGQLDADRCPESKVTRELCNDKRLGLHPIVVAIDEFQRYGQHPQYGEQIVDLLVDLAKVGPAAGIILILATQKPDADSLPSKLRDVIGTRFALKTMTYQASDTILGAGSYSAGYDASRFLRSHKGVGWLLGADDSGGAEEAVTVRTYLADAAAVEKVIARAHAARVAAGRLTGQAAGIEPEKAIVAADTLLADVARILASPDGPKAWSEVILERLATYSTAYETLTRDELTARMRALGVATVQAWGTDPDTGKGANRRGYALDDIQTAITKSDKPVGRKRAR